MTPTLGLLLTTCVLVTAPARKRTRCAGPGNIATSLQIAVGSSARLAAVDRAALCWAALLTLKPEDAKREQERVAKILHQKIVGWNDLLELAATIGSTREGGHRPPCARNTVPRSTITFRTQPARPGRSSGGLVSHLVAMGKGGKSARTARSAHGLASGSHQGFQQGVDRSAAARPKVWRWTSNWFPNGSSSSSRQQPAARSACNHAGRTSAVGRQFPARAADAGRSRRI